jgi:hypothetical protein
MRHLTTATVIATLLLSASGSAWGADAKSSGSITLKYDAKGAVRAQTPAWASKANRFSVGSSSRMGIKVAGTSIVTSARIVGNRVLLGIDRSGDGTISRAEWAPVPASGTMMISGKTGDSSYVVRLMDISTRFNTKKVVSCWGQALIRSSMGGTLNGTTIRLMDDNMDGKFTQKSFGFSGGDAILIGSASAAVPLKEIHRIGKDLYRLKVASDGSSIDYERLDDTAIGQVKANFPSSVLKSLILVGKDCAFDVKTDGMAGIPGGEYKLAYGVVGRGSATLTFKPGMATPKYEIQDGMVNTLRIGLPMRLAFSPSYRAGKVSLSARAVSVVGSGSEIYAPIDFTKTGNARPPSVIMLNGARIASSSTMEYG